VLIQYDLKIFLAAGAVGVAAVGAVAERRVMLLLLLLMPVFAYIFNLYIGVSVLLCFLVLSSWLLLLLLLLHFPDIWFLAKL
jgi:hypothetical protein